MKYEESDRVELKREMIKDLDKEIIAFFKYSWRNYLYWR